MAKAPAIPSSTRFQRAAGNLIRTPFQRRLPLAMRTLYRQDPVPPHIERHIFQQPIDERRAVAVGEPHEANLALLGMAVGEGQSLSPLILPAQGFVAALRR